MSEKAKRERKVALGPCTPGVCIPAKTKRKTTKLLIFKKATL